MFGINSVDGYHDILEGIKIKSVNYGKGMIMTEFQLSKGAVLPEHSHVNEQAGYLVKGCIRLFVDGKSRVMKPGDSWNIGPDIKHKAEIIEDSVAIEIFTPAREDYLKYINENDIIK
jgi:quercetin dioxygenase-like cupin family protein